MGLGFLVPAFFAGLAALAVPIWVHLRNRPKTDTVEFPSLMFIERIPYRSVQKQELRHRLLFAVRCLAIMLLVLAFARPFLGDSAPGTAATGSREVVLVVDRSWSMGFTQRWDDTLAALRDELGKLRADDRVSVVLFDEQAEVVIESQPPAGVAGDLLAGLAPGDLSTSYAAGLRAAAGILAASGMPAAEVVLISDFQRSGGADGVEIVFPERAVLRPVNVAPESGENVAISDVALDRLQGTDGQQLVVTARLVRQGGAEPRAVTAVLRVDGEEVQRRPVALPAAGAARVEFAAFDAVGQQQIEVEIPRDDLPGDDVFGVVARPGQALSVLVLGNPGTGGNDSLYLARALGVGSRPGFAVDSQVLRDLRGTDLAGRDLVVLNDPGAVDTGSVATLVDFVAAGGGILLAWAELSDQGVEGLLPYQPADVVDRTTGQGGSLGFVDTDHPIFDAYRSPDAGDLSRARFYRYRDVSPRPEAGVLARFDDGTPALLEHALGEGRVLVWTSSLDTFWTDLPLQPMFVPLMHELSKHATGYREERTWTPATPELEPGFRTVASPDGPRTVAVNRNRRESDLAPLDAEELLAGVAFGSGAGISEAATPPSPARIEAAQSLWWYVLLVAALLLLAEAALSNRLSSRASWRASPVGDLPRERPE